MLGWIRDLVDELVSLSGRAPRTFWALLVRPGFLTAEWENGRRARYITPLRLYIVSAAVYFALWGFMAPRSAAAALFAGFFEADTGNPVSDEYLRTVLARVADIIPPMMVALMPAFAALHRLMLGSKRRFYVSHLTFALHYHAAYFLIGVLAMPLASSGLPGIRNLGFYWALTYLAVANRRVYGSRTGWRSVAFIATYGLVVAVVLVVAALITINE